MEHYVYTYYDPSRAEKIYVGMGKGKRAWYHLKRSDVHPFVQRLQLLERSGVSVMIDFLCANVDRELAELVEQEAIAKFGRKDLGKGPLLNLTDGGEGLKNVTDSTRQKIGDASRARRSTPQSRARAAAALLGRKRGPMSEEVKDKIRQKALGRVLSVEHKAKIGAGVAVSIRPPCKEETKAKIGAANHAIWVKKHGQ